MKGWAEHICQVATARSIKLLYCYGMMLDADSAILAGDAQIDIAIKTKLRPARGGSQLQTMHDCHNGLELGCQAATSPAVKQVLSRYAVLIIQILPCIQRFIPDHADMLHCMAAAKHRASAHSRWASAHVSQPSEYNITAITAKLLAVEKCHVCSSLYFQLLPL